MQLLMSRPLERGIILINREEGLAVTMAVGFLARSKAGGHVERSIDGNPGQGEPFWAFIYGEMGISEFDDGFADTLITLRTQLELVSDGTKFQHLDSDGSALKMDYVSMSHSYFYISIFLDLHNSSFPSFQVSCVLPITIPPHLAKRHYVRAQGIIPPHLTLSRIVG